MKHYTGAIFDMDGVLFDTEKIWQACWREIADEMGVCLEEGFTRAVCGTNGEVMSRVIERYYHVADGHGIMGECKRRVHEKLSKDVPLKEGAVEILRTLKASNLRLALASGSPRAQIEANLERTGLRHYFDALISGEEVSAGKPDPEIFLTSAKMIGCKPEECFVFEDSLSGVQAGHAAGCDTIMVPDLVKPTPEIIPLCFRICESLLQFVIPNA